MITVRKSSNIFLRIFCEDSISYELNEYFTFNVPNAKFSPAFKNKVWDGKIRLFHLMKKTLYVGLFDKLREFAESRNYELVLEEELNDTEYSVVEAKSFIDKIRLPKTFEVRDYQLEAFVHAIRKSRCLLLSPTGSGKSLIIYLLSQYYRHTKVLIIVPTVGLVHQMASDFISYGCNPKDIHAIYSGQEKITDSPFVISTWQSIFNHKKQWFEVFGTVIGDEAHQYKAKSLVSIMENSVNAEFRFGFTGTLDGMQTNELVIQGLFGPIKKVTTTAELIDQQYLADFKIKALVLQYSDSERQLVKNMMYKDEIDFLITHKSRNTFIRNLIASLQGNTLLLFNFISHGKHLKDIITPFCRDKEVFFVYGEIEGDVREQIRNQVETMNNAVIIASFGTFSTGINIKNIHNIVFAVPTKSKIRNLQSLGRGLRKGEQKQKATLFDIADDLTWKSHTNTTLKHFSERISLYNDERFVYKIYSIQLKERA